MGDIIGGLIGGAASLIGGSKAAKADLTGYNYLTGSKGTQGYVDTGKQAQQQQVGAVGQEAGTVGQESALLGGGTPEAQAQQKQAFGNFLNSTQYGFQLQQGTAAITGSAAAKGLLGSGATAKALAQYGQGLAGSAFGNYFSNMNSVANQQNNVATGYGNVAKQGLNAAGQIGDAGTTGGGNAGNAQQSGISSAGGQFGSAFGSLLGMI